MKTYILLLGILSVALGWRPYKVLFVSFPFEANKDYVDMKVDIKNETGDTTLNIRVNVIEPMDDLTLTYAISVDVDGGNVTTVVNRTTNFCKFLVSKFYEPILKVFYEDLLRHGNFFKICPLKKGVYYVHDYRADEEMLPAYIPESNLYVDVLVTLPKKTPPAFKGRLRAMIDTSKGFNNMRIFSLG